MLTPFSYKIHKFVKQPLYTATVSELMIWDLECAHVVIFCPDLELVKKFTQARLFRRTFYPKECNLTLGGLIGVYLLWIKFPKVVYLGRLSRVTLPR